MPRIAFILFLFLSSAFAFAQSEKGLTQQDRDRMDRMAPRTLLPLIKNGFVTPHWIPHTDEFWYRRQEKAGTMFVVVDAAGGRSRPAFDHRQLAEALAKVTGPPQQSRRSTL